MAQKEKTIEKLIRLLNSQFDNKKMHVNITYAKE